MASNNNSNYESLFTSGSFIIAIIVIFLVFMGIYIYRSYKSFKTQKDEELGYRLRIADCPDYWEKVGPKKCRNKLKVNGKCNLSIDNDIIDFDNDIFNNKKLGDKMKCKWAKDCDVVWSGINNLC
jgi:hypothetical protein